MIYWRKTSSSEMKGRCFNVTISFFFLNPAPVEAFLQHRTDLAEDGSTDSTSGKVKYVFGGGGGEEEE